MTLLKPEGPRLFSFAIVLLAFLLGPAAVSARATNLCTYGEYVTGNMAANGGTLQANFAFYNNYAVAFNQDGDGGTGLSTNLVATMYQLQGNQGLVVRNDGATAVNNAHGWLTMLHVC